MASPPALYFPVWLLSGTAHQRMARKSTNPDRLHKEHWQQQQQQHHIMRMAGCGHVRVGCGAVYHGWQHKQVAHFTSHVVAGSRLMRAQWIVVNRPHSPKRNATKKAEQCKKGGSWPRLGVPVPWHFALVSSPPLLPASTPTVRSLRRRGAGTAGRSFGGECAQTQQPQHRPITPKGDQGKGFPSSCTAGRGQYLMRWWTQTSRE